MQPCPVSLFHHRPSSHDSNPPAWAHYLISSKTTGNYWKLKNNYSKIPRKTVSLFRQHSSSHGSNPPASPAHYLTSSSKLIDQTSSWGKLWLSKKRITHNQGGSNHKLNSSGVRTQSMEESQQVYIWCSMRFHKYVSACISVYYVFLVQYALDPGFTRPPRTHFRWTGPQFYTTAPSFSLLPHFTLPLPLLSAPFITILL